MRPNPLSDLIAFLTKPAWPTAVFWLLLLASIAIAATALRRGATRHPLHDTALWLLRLAVGAMWWQQSLWKIPPNYDGLLFWMKQMVDHAAIPLQGALVGSVVVPNIALFGPAVYAVEVLIGVLLMLGLFTRLAALLGAAMAANLWLGLYSAPGEWPWTYGFLLIIQLIFLIDPPGRALGLDALSDARRRPHGQSRHSRMPPPPAVAADAPRGQAAAPGRAPA